MPKLLWVAALLCLTMPGCVPASTALDKLDDLTSVMSQRPAMQWDHKPEASDWTDRAMAAVAAQDDQLAQIVPSDIDSFCPGYAKAQIQDRRAFWVGLLSAVAKYESGWNAKAVGGKGRYIGLMQISTKTAAQHGCSATSSAALKDGAANLECAIEIMATQVGRDQAVAGGGNRGIARDWGPMQKKASRAQVAEWTRTQAYCAP